MRLLAYGIVGTLLAYAAALWALLRGQSLGGRPSHR
jgi:hypothetical protein